MSTPLSTDPALYIFTSLTAGSSHIVTATSRLETILRANRVPFKALDISTDDKARMLWRRRAGKDANGRPRKFPALVQEGMVLGDIVEIEEWNEYGELKQHVKIYYDEHTIPDIHHKHPPLRMKKPNMMQRAGSAAGSIVGKKLVPKVDSTPPSSNLGTPAPANPPPAPDLSKAGALDLNKSASAPAAADKGKEAEKPKPVEKEKKKAETLPMRSVADEAAQKAKELRLKSLREKVHGKGAGDKKPDDAKAEEKKDATTSEEKKLAVATPKKDSAGASTPSLQSPTSGKWKTDSSTPAEDIQSPRSSTWKPAVADAPEKEIKKVEEKEAVKEQPKKETELAKKDEDEDDDSDEDEDEDDSEEESEDDSDDDDDEDDSDEDSDEDEKKPAAKPATAKTSAAAPTTTEQK